jgi:hypothetical protein
MPFMKVAPKPGMFTDGTRYSAEGTWYDADKVRFRKGFAEKLGGWTKLVIASFLGTCRAAHDWVTDSGNKYLGVATHLKLYIQTAGEYHDITPIRSTVTLGTDPIATIDDTAVITFTTASAHGAMTGDYVTIAGATSSGGIGTGSLNKEHRIVALGDPDGANTTTKFRVVCDAQATSTDTAEGGSSVTAAFQINIGLDTYVDGAGWGSSWWGDGSWDTTSSIGQATQLRIWSLDTFGEDLLACARQGKIYYWDETNGTTTRAIPLEDVVRRSVTLTSNPITTTSGGTSITYKDKGGHGAAVGDLVTISGVSGTIGGISAARLNVEVTVTSVLNRAQFTADIGGANASGTASGGGSSVGASYKAGTYYPPVGSYQVLMSQIGRHVIALGCTGVNSTTINPMNVRWSSSETVGTWQALSTNSAGGQQLALGSEIIGGLSTRQETLIWTDAGMVSMRYIGSPFYFSFTEVARGMSMMSPNAAVNANGKVFFMDRGDFYVYTGSVKKLDCTVLTTVFNDLDISQKHKVTSGSNPAFSEVIWFYPSASGNGENDRYVIYNYQDNIWYTGSLVRGVWIQADTKTHPLASSIRTISINQNKMTTTVSSLGNVSIEVGEDDGYHFAEGDTIMISGATDIGGLEAVLLNTQHIIKYVYPDKISFTVADTATAATGSDNMMELMPGNVIYKHEDGYDDDLVPMTAYIETGDMDLVEGDKTWSIHRIIPDIYFTNASIGTPTFPGSEVTISINGHNFPADTQTSVASVAFQANTAEGFVRARARQISMKVESNDRNFGWRVGFVRLDGREDSRR